MAELGFEHLLNSISQRRNALLSLKKLYGIYRIYCISIICMCMKIISGSDNMSFLFTFSSSATVKTKIQDGKDYLEL